MQSRWLIALLAVPTIMVIAQGGDEVRKIPLDQIGTTTGQKGIKKMTTAMDGAGKYVEPYGQDLEKLRRVERRAPYLLLVTGKDLAAAVSQTRNRIGESDSKKPAPTVEAMAGDILWVACFFGINGSRPPAFEVEAVEIKGKTVRITYTKGAAVTDDIHHYYAWAPLGKVTAGDYTLELVESKSKEVTLTRACKVAVK